jgi:hypothetical protein
MGLMAEDWGLPKTVRVFYRLSMSVHQTEKNNARNRPKLAGAKKASSHPANSCREEFPRHFGQIGTLISCFG